MSTALRDGPDALAALLAYVAQVRDRQLGEIRAATQRECKAVLGAARARAREQVRQALREARRDADGQVALARAGAQARLRRARQALTTASLSGVRGRVEQGVRARWADPAGRRAWIAMALAEAARHLPAGTWTITHPAGVPPEALAAVPEGVTLEARADPAVEAGLHIGCGEARVDASLTALLRSEARVASLWLGELERRRAGTAGSP